jgi:hypothetical protein
MLPETLIALACMIANKGPVDTSSLEAQLSGNEKAQVDIIIQTGACLPEKMEKLVKDTQNQIKQGKIGNITAQGNEPTRGC